MASSLLVILLFCLTLHSSSATDRLRPGESIVSNQTLLSSSGNYVLGFFSPSNSTSKSYLGIWRNGSDVRTAIWVANRKAPVPLSRAVFRLSKSSNLEVADSNGTLLWSSATSPSDPNSTVAVLLDSGDLVLRGENGTMLWRSFDYPTDTVLPKMPIWVNYKTHKAATATSWRSFVDPSPGEFQVSLDPDTPLQGIVMRGSRKWWRSNVWNGVSFADFIPGNSRVVPYMSFVVDPNSWNISFTSSVLEGAMAARLEYNGTGVLRIWTSNTKVWVPVYTFNGEPCETYGLCGAFGYCSQATTKCSCLDGFEPRNRSEWNSGDYRSGCARKFALACDERDEFALFPKMKLPDYNIYLRDIRNGSACREACRSNCSCVAYAYSDLWTGSEMLPRCLVWRGGELLDLVARDDNSHNTGENFYVRVHNLDSGKNGKKKSGKVVVTVSLVAGLALAAFVTCFIWRCKRPPRDAQRKVEEGNGVVDGFSILNGGEIEQGYRDLPLLEYGVVATATDNFSDRNINRSRRFRHRLQGKRKVLQGFRCRGSATSRGGILPGGTEVAIKRLSEESSQGMVEFKNEVVLIAQLRHRNLVKLLNCCLHGEEKLLIYEYMPNKSLELLLFDSENERRLDWGKRLNIIKGISRGLLYLHEDSRLRIIHRDLKASNILLDGEMNPKISDFGMARIFDSGENQANTRRVVGTYGYMAPEYAMEGLFSAKSDVYSFGVLLLEIISGQKNINFQPTAAFPSLLSYAWDLWKSANLKEFISHSLQDSCSYIEAAKCVHIGLLCVQDVHTQRPNMSSVVFMLENEALITSTPEKPTYTGWTAQDDNTHRTPNLERFSVNNLSISVLEGR